LLDQLLRRLELLHSKNYLHRDTKPENFLLGLQHRGNTVYMTDLGLAKYRHPERWDTESPPVRAATKRTQGQTPGATQRSSQPDSLEGRSNAERRASRIHQVLRELAEILNDLQSFTGSIQPTVWDAVLILSSTLLTVAYYLYRSYNFPFKFVKLFEEISPRQLVNLYDMNGGCVRERKIIRDMAEGDN